VFFHGGRVDAQILAGPNVLRTANATRTRCGLAQVRRLIESGPLLVAHVVFAPMVARPLLLGLVRLRNAGAAPLVLDYTELWEVGAGAYRVTAAAAELRTPEGVRALADASSAIRARAPEAAPARGLALDLRIALPPRETRHLEFAYVAPGADDVAPELLVAAFRGGVRLELARTASAWLRRLAAAGDPLAEYAKAVATLPACSGS
jgi:hypothetical protein